jgi:hypothetical protein
MGSILTLFLGAGPPQVRARLTGDLGLLFYQRDESILFVISACFVG